MKDSEIVAAARDLISDPKAWARGKWCAQRGDGGLVMCAEGAVRVATSVAEGRNLEPDLISTFHTDQTNRIERALAKVGMEMIPEVFEVTGCNADNIDLYDINDLTHVTEDGELIFITHHEDVLAIFDKTAALLEEEGK